MKRFGSITSFMLDGQQGMQHLITNKREWNNNCNEQNSTSINANATINDKCTVAGDHL